MSLTKPYDLKWIEINAYFKINSLFVTEQWKDEEWKLYNLKVEVISYTTPGKQYDIEWKTYDFSWVRESWLNIANAYVLLKTLSEFSSAVDA